MFQQGHTNKNGIIDYNVRFKFILIDKKEYKRIYGEQNLLLFLN